MGYKFQKQMRKKIKVLGLTTALAGIGLCIASLSLHAQEGANDAFEIAVKVRASLLIHNSQDNASFNYGPSHAAGGQLLFTRNYSTWALETGIGADRMVFAQRSTALFESTFREAVDVKFAYFALHIPLTAYYALPRDFRVSCGVHLMGINLSSYTVGVSSRAVGASGFSTIPASDFPGWQWTAELQTGLSKQLSPKVDLGLHLATSLRRIEAMDLAFESDGGQLEQRNFSYTWLRVGIEARYRLR